MKLTPYGLGGTNNPSGYFYTDALAIYQGKDGAGNWTGQPSDPENQLSWVLKDAAGELLYINYSLPFQWTGDITNPAFQSRMGEWILNQCRNGYTGVELDDVNYAVSDPNTGAQVPPTVTAAGAPAIPVIGGKPVTAQQWGTLLNAYCAKMAQIVKTIYPTYRVLHNTFWRDTGFSPNVAADIFIKEFGISCDAGLTGGTEFWSLYGLFQWCDSIHAAGKSVLIMETAPTLDFTYSLACSLLMTNGADYWEARNFTLDPASLALLGRDIGNALTSRYRTPKGLWVRTFEGATVFVNEPGAAPVSVAGVTLQPRQGVIIWNV